MLKPRKTKQGKTSPSRTRGKTWLPHTFLKIILATSYLGFRELDDAIDWDVLGDVRLVVVDQILGVIVVTQLVGLQAGADQLTDPLQITWQEVNSDKVHYVYINTDKVHFV